VSFYNYGVLNSYVLSILFFFGFYVFIELSYFQ